MKKVLSLVLALMLVLSCFGSIALADDVPTLKVLVRHDPRCPKIGELDNYKRAEEAAGVKIEWEYITSDAWKEQKSLVLASGDLPDIFFGTQTIHPADILANIEYFIPLDELVAEYGDQIQEMWEVYPSSKIANTMPDGKVYGIGRYMPNRPTTLIGNYINKVWLDNLGLAVPTTLEELEQVLIAFRDQDADGDGDTTDEVPILALSPSDAKRGIQAFRGYFQAENCVENEFGVIDGKVTFMPATEEYRQWIEWSHWLLEEGLINPDCVTLDRATWTAMLGDANGAAGGVICTWTNDEAGANMDDFVVLDIQEGPNGKAYMAGNKANLACGVSQWCAASITVNCENPEAAMRWINYFYDDANGAEAANGPVGLVYEIDENGVYRFMEDQYETTGYHIYDNWYYSLGDQNMGWISPEFEKNYFPPTPIEERKYTVDQAYLDNVRDESFIVPPMVFDRDSNDRAIEIKTDIDKLLKETVADWFVNGITDEQWNEYLKQLDKMGLQEYIEIYQTRLDEIRGN